MKKLFYYSTFFLLLLSISCNNDDLSVKSEVSETQVLDFSSENEMKEKSAEINQFKKNKENQIVNKIFKNINLEVFEDKETSISNSNTKIDDKTILENLKFYHTERLNSIYEERIYFNFTSIQSIADEINSLKLLNPERAEILYNKHEQFLHKSDYLTSTIFVNELSNVINTTGKVTINGKEFLKNNSTSNRFVRMTDIKEGILTTNGQYTITWHVGISEHRGDIGNTYYGNFAQLGSYVNSGYGFILYPSWFSVTADSEARFSAPATMAYRTVKFQSGYGSVLFNEDVNSWSRDYWNKQFFTEGKITGNFATNINGNVIYLSSSKILTNR